MKTKQALVAVLVPLAAGCVAIASQLPRATTTTVPVKPDVQVQRSSVGQDRSVVVLVEDARASLILGQGAGSKITSEGDLAAPIRSALIDGLQRQGFAAITANASDKRELRVEIRSLDYEIHGNYKLKTRTACVLAAECVISSTHPYERLYRAEQSGDTFPTSMKSDDADKKYVNDVVSKALNDLLADENLMKCLAQ